MSSTLYRINNGLSKTSKEFVQEASKIYTKTGKSKGNFKRPKNIKQSINFLKYSGYKVYYKSDGWLWNEV